MEELRAGGISGPTCCRTRRHSLSVCALPVAAIGGSSVAGISLFGFLYFELAPDVDVAFFSPESNSSDSALL